MSIQSNLGCCGTGPAHRPALYCAVIYQLEVNLTIAARRGPLISGR